MLRRTVEEARRTQIYQITKEVLAEECLSLNIESVSLQEDFSKDTTEISCRFREGDGPVKEVSAEGYGVLDALFTGMLGHYSEKFPSLKNISFEAFNTRPDFSKRRASGADAEIEVSIQFTNSSNTVMTFRNKGNSFVKASVEGVFNALEFYINCERSFKKLKFLIEEARSRGRSDVAQKYVSKISAIVRITSYEEV